MSKLKTDFSVALAGMCSGLFAVSLFLLAERIDTYYAYLGWLRETNYRLTYDRGVENLWWVPVALWHVVLSIVASLLIHRHLATGRVSTFLRWQVIGFMALVGWGLTFAIGVGMECLSHGNLSLWHTWSYTELITVTQFVAAVFASNVLYGSAVQAASSERILTENSRSF